MYHAEMLDFVVVNIAIVYMIQVPMT